MAGEIPPFCVPKRKPFPGQPYLQEAVRGKGSQYPELYVFQDKGDTQKPVEGIVLD